MSLDSRNLVPALVGEEFGHSLLPEETSLISQFESAFGVFQSHATFDQSQEIARNGKCSVESPLRPLIPDDRRRLPYRSTRNTRCFNGSILGRHDFVDELSERYGRVTGWEKLNFKSITTINKMVIRVDNLFPQCWGITGFAP